MKSPISWRWAFSLQLKKSSMLSILGLLFTAIPFTFFIIQEPQQIGQGTISFTRNPHSYLSQNPIYQENQRPGTTRWQSIGLNTNPNQQMRSRPQSPAITSKSNIDSDRGNNSIAAAGGWTDTEISGYANMTSVNHGDPIQFYVSTSQPNYNIEVYRIGWYDGAGGRLMLAVFNLPGQKQLIPTPQAGTGLIECHWRVSYTLQTASSWMSGVYLVKLTAADGALAYILFVLRDDGAPADILYQVPVATYQAYNNWGGKSLYDYNSTGGRAYKVSYDRPYASWDGAGDFFAGDYNMIRWLESQSYNVTYVTSLDIQTNPNIFRNRKVFLSNWHDEYWSKSMRDNLTSALNHGENLAFFDANNMYWQFRFEPSTTGVANRVEVCYKQASLDPLTRSQPSLTTVNWRISPVNEPENALLGVMFESGFGYSSSFPWVVTNSSHWIYSGTGLKDGDEIPGLVGNEYDKVWRNGLTPARLTVLSNSPVVDENGIHSLANGTIYTAASNAMVFSAGTLHWSWKLDDNLYQSHGADPRVRRMTANVLNAMIHGIPSRHTTTNRALPQPSDGRLTMLLMIVGITLWIALLAVLVWAVMRRINRRAMTPRLRDPQVLILLNPPSAMEILRQRYASGEIDSITFEEIRERLENSSTRKPPIILDSP